jgi:hypothetical protein
LLQYVSLEETKFSGKRINEQINERETQKSKALAFLAIAELKAQPTCITKINYGHF